MSEEIVVPKKICEITQKSKIIVLIKMLWCTSYAWSCPRSNVMSHIKTDEQLVVFTGINFELLNGLEKSVKLCESNRYAKNFINCARDRIVLSLCKLRINLSFRCLSVLFGLNRQSCAHNFYYMVKLLSKIVKRSIYCMVCQNVLKVLKKHE